MKTKINSGFSYPHLSTDGFREGSMFITEQEYKRYLTISKGLSVKSVKTYLARYKILDKWLANNKKELSRNSIEEFLYDKKQAGQSNASINTYIQAFNHIAGCYKAHGLKSDFMNDIGSLPKQKSVIIPLSKEESNLLISTELTYMNRNGVDCSSLDFYYLTLTEFFLYTGCRFDEAASLRVKNVDINKGNAYLAGTKNKKNRYIFYTGPIKDHLRKIIKDKSPEDLVFSNSKGNKILNGDFDNNVKRRAKSAGITKKVNAHLLRHTFGTLYYNQTHDIEMTATLLGHQDINVTHETYVHLDTEGIQQGYNRYPLASSYIPVKDVLESLKKLIEYQKISDDSRFNFQLEISNNELVLKVKAKEA